MLGGEQLNAIKIECHANNYLKTSFLCIDLDGSGVVDRQAQREREEPEIIKKHRSVVSTHADPSNSSQMQLETPGGAGVSCPCERRAIVELKPKIDTGLCVAK